MTKKKIPSLDEMLRKGAEDAKKYREGALKLRTTIVDEKTGERETFMESLPEAQERKKRAHFLIFARKEFGQSQKEMAALLDISIRTYQGWEMGRPIPGPAYHLVEAIWRYPQVKSYLSKSAGFSVGVSRRSKAESKKVALKT